MTDGKPAYLTIARPLDRASFAVAAGTAIWGLFIISLWWPGLTQAGGWWAIDSRRVIQASGVWLAGGNPYDVFGFVYSPLALLVALPFRIIGEWAWFAIEAIALIWLSLRASRGLDSGHRGFLVLVGFLFLPAASDLGLGNITIVLTSLALVAISADRPSMGIAFGLGLAAVPKPLFVPILLWMLRYRRRSLGGVVVAGLFGTLLGLVILGADRYWAFISTLTAGGSIPSDFVGNYGLSTISPLLAVLGNIVGLAVVATSVILLPMESSLMVASLAGVFMGSYAGIYAGLPILIALPLFAVRHHRQALAIGALSGGFVLAMPLFAVAGMLASVIPFRRPASGAAVGRDPSENVIKPG